MWTNDDFRKVFAALQECKEYFKCPAEYRSAANDAVFLGDIETGLEALRKIADDLSEKRAE